MLSGLTCCTVFYLRHSHNLFLGRVLLGRRYGKLRQVASPHFTELGFCETCGLPLSPTKERVADFLCLLQVSSNPPSALGPWSPALIKLGSFRTRADASRSTQNPDRNMGSWANPSSHQECRCILQAERNQPLPASYLDAF